MKKYLIIDPCGHMPSLYFVLTSNTAGVKDEVMYYSNTRKSHLPWGPYNGSELSDLYGFKSYCLETEEDKKIIFTKDWDCIFVVFTLHPAFFKDQNVAGSKDYFIKLMNEIKNECYSNKIVIIDNSDESHCYYGDLEKNQIAPDVLFKKEYNKNLEVYAKHCKPFPYVVLGYQDPLWILNERKWNTPTEQKVDRIYWAGTPTMEVNADRKQFYNRTEFLDKLGFLLTCGSPPSNARYASNDYMQELDKSKFFLYLRGQARLTRRLFEGLSVGSLMLMENTGVTFNFVGNGFARECLFDIPTECQTKLEILRNDPKLFEYCLQEQERVIRENFTYEAAKKYIEKFI